MKRVLVILAFVLICVEASAQKKFLLSGADSKSIVLVDKATNKVEWRNDNAEGCSSAIYCEGGNVAYAYLGGVKLIDPAGNAIFDYKVKEGELAYSVSAIKDGFLVGIAGAPVRIVELNKQGEVVNELLFDSGANDKTNIFRQVIKTRNGTYVVPVAEQNKVVEINAQGRMLKVVELEHAPMYVTANESGNLFFTCGKSGYIYEIDGESAEIYTFISSTDLGDGVTLEDGAGIVTLKNENYLVVNTTSADSSQPILVELDMDGEVAWKMSKPEGVGAVSSVSVVY